MLTGTTAATKDNRPPRRHQHEGQVPDKSHQERVQRCNKGSARYELERPFVTFPHHSHHCRQGWFGCFIFCML